MLAGESLADAALRAHTIMAEEGLTLVHPYDDARVIAGQGTVGLELVRDFPDADVLVVPIGGGGLIAGVAVAAKALRPSLEIIGVETALYPSFHQIRNGLPPVHGGQSIAEGIAVKSIGEMSLEIARTLVDDVVLVSERAIECAIHVFLEEEKLLAEGAAAAVLAALLETPARFANRRVALVVSGGNIDTGLLAQRLFHDVSSKNAELDITFEARTPADVERIAARLRTARYVPLVLESTAKPSL